MNDSSVKNTLEVTNFGPIAEARIDLRPLTVFVGPSNTGKSYLAVLIYALHRHFDQHRRQMSYWHPAGKGHAPRRACRMDERNSRRPGKHSGK